MYIDYFQCPQLFTTFVYISSSPQLSLYICPCLSVCLSYSCFFVLFCDTLRLTRAISITVASQIYKKHGLPLKSFCFYNKYIV